MDNLIKDTRYALRSLRQHPAFALIAITTLALGIGASTAIFSAVHAVLLRSLPYGNADRIVTVWESNQRNAKNVTSGENFLEWKQKNHCWDDRAAFFDFSAKLTGEGDPEEIPSQIATPIFFSVLGVNAIRGRTFTADDGKDNQPG